MRNRFFTYNSKGEVAFKVFNYLFLGAIAILCILPMINVLAISFSDSTSANANLVKLLPMNFSLKSYQVILNRPDVLNSLWISTKRTIIGVIINGLLTISMAYPLSKNKKVFPGRNYYMYSILVVMLFSGGLVPLYILVMNLGLRNTI